MTTHATSAKLTIFEGPDGSGKTTAAQAYAELTGAKYVHFPALPKVTYGLARMYVEAMLPALQGYQDVVFDRCWLSELPYGMAFRHGKLRLSAIQNRMLERLAMRCGAVVVRCLPSWEVVKSNYLDRRHLEMLENEDQLREVYDIYKAARTGLPSVKYDYTTMHARTVATSLVDSFRAHRHPLEAQSAGDWRARIILVGESFAERKEHDPWYQWPFASFSNEGCSQWLTGMLETYDIRESDLLWFNADQDLSLIKEYYLQHRLVIALGSEAYKELSTWSIQARQVPHPQYWKRFESVKPYPLLDLITKGRTS